MHGAASDTLPVAQALIAAGELPELRGFKTSTAAAKRKARKEKAASEAAEAEELSAKLGVGKHVAAPSAGDGMDALRGALAVRQKERQVRCPAPPPTAGPVADCSLLTVVCAALAAPQGAFDSLVSSLEQKCGPRTVTLTPGAAAALSGSIAVTCAPSAVGMGSRSHPRWARARPSTRRQRSWTTRRLRRCSRRCLAVDAERLHTSVWLPLRCAKRRIKKQREQQAAWRRTQGRFR